MHDTHDSMAAADQIAERAALLGQLKALIERSAELLPAQGPLTAFAFLNTLQALEDLPFDQGVKRGARLFGCQPYLTEDQYRDKLIQGRIRAKDLAAVVAEDLGDQAHVRICSFGTRYEMRLAMLRYPLRSAPAEELRWFVAETDALTRFRPEVAPEIRTRLLEETRHWVMRDLRSVPGLSAAKGAGRRDARVLLDDMVEQFGKANIERWSAATWEALALQALWRVCREGAHGVVEHAEVTVDEIRHRELLLEATNEDSDTLVHEVLIRFCAAFTDQGFAPWRLPNREQGFYRSFFTLYQSLEGPTEPWLHGLPKELERLDREGIGPLESILESLELLGVTRNEWDVWIAATMLALRGWAGIIWQMEVRPDRVPVAAPAGSLIEFLAIRLILERLALTDIARRALDYRGPLNWLRVASRAAISKPSDDSIERRAFQIFQIAQVLGWHPLALHALSKQEWASLVGEVRAFSGFERRRLYQLAFERRYRAQALDAIAVQSQRPVERVKQPRFQATFCIDAREESFRRHLEEVAPDVETFGAAGFFSVPIYYRGVADAHFATLCPIVVRPQHWVTEEVVYSLKQSNQTRAGTRRALGTAAHQVHMGSRSVTGGALLTAGLGVLATIPLVARVLFPRLTARIRKSAAQFVRAPAITRLRLERADERPSSDDPGIGFSVAEMANFGERVLRDIGLTSNFARLVMFFGHGSVCLNNPHKSAYDCGACSGSAGGPNARTLAAMLNDPRARAILSERGMAIPGETYFLGGLHNTCTDTIEFYDLDLMPKTHIGDFEWARDVLEQTCERNAHERCRRFDSAPLDITPAEAWRHVEGRAEDLAQTRPEFGNATNALGFVGRRERVRGLYMDRRCFMHSYDPKQDGEDYKILERILGPVIFVCAGINLQYYFSYVDSPGWGSGSKLPHNVTSLLGVMDGSASDLRCGLPWQGVEIHEPLRLLFVIECSPRAMLAVMERNPVVGRIIRNNWAQLALLDPDSNEILVYREGDFHVYRPETHELPKVVSSFDWYRGWREHLGFAAIEPELESVWKADAPPASGVPHPPYSLG